MIPGQTQPFAQGPCPPPGRYHFPSLRRHGWLRASESLSLLSLLRDRLAWVLAFGCQRGGLLSCECTLLVTCFLKGLQTTLLPTCSRQGSCSHLLIHALARLLAPTTVATCWALTVATPCPLNWPPQGHVLPSCPPSARKWNTVAEEDERLGERRQGWEQPSVSAPYPPASPKTNQDLPVPP